MSIQQFSLFGGSSPFSFRTNSNGSTHIKVETTFQWPQTDNKRTVWCKEYPEISTVPEAVALVVNNASECTGEPMHWKMIQSQLKSMFDLKKSKGSCTGNMANAIKQGLISEVKLRDFNDGQKAGWKMVASNKLAKQMNVFCEYIVDWVNEDRHDRTQTDMYCFMINFGRTLQQKGTRHFDLSQDEDTSLPF
jgi:hypothetical protein